MQGGLKPGPGGDMNMNSVEEGVAAGTPIKKSGGAGRNVVLAVVLETVEARRDYNR